MNLKCSMRYFSNGLIVFFLICCCAALGWCGEVDAVDTVTSVVDGDTLYTSVLGKIRLADIDAPEETDLGFNESKDYLTSLVLNKAVYIDIDNKTGKDPHDRWVCILYVEYNDTHVLNVNQQMVLAGHAVLDNSTNNEFDPYAWNLYEPDEAIPEFASSKIMLLLLLSTLIIATVKMKRPRSVNGIN